MPRARPHVPALAPLTAPPPAASRQGPILGFRAWKVTRDGWLHAVVADHAWQPGRNDAAACDDDHEAPGAGCHCGLNAFGDPWALEHSPYLGTRCVAGAVAQWGHAHVHRLGARSEHARVVALVVPDDPEHRRAARLAARRYRVPLLDTETDLAAYALEHAAPLPDDQVDLEPLSLLFARPVAVGPAPETTGLMRGPALRAYRWHAAATMTQWAVQHALRTASRDGGQHLLWELRACLLGCLNAAATSDPWRNAPTEIANASRALARGPLTFADVHPAGGDPPETEPPPLDDTSTMFQVPLGRLAAAVWRHRNDLGDDVTHELASTILDLAAGRGRVTVGVPYRTLHRHHLSRGRLDRYTIWTLSVTGLPAADLVDHPAVSPTARLELIADEHTDPTRLLADPRVGPLLDDPAVAASPLAAVLDSTPEVSVTIAQQIAGRHPLTTLHPSVLRIVRDTTPDPGLAEAATAELAARQSEDRATDHDPPGPRHAGPDASFRDRLELAASGSRTMPSARPVLSHDDADATLEAARDPVAAARTLRALLAVARKTAADDRADSRAAEFLHGHLAAAVTWAAEAWDDRDVLEFARRLGGAPAGPHFAVYARAVALGHNHGVLQRGPGFYDLLAAVLARPPARTPEDARVLSGALEAVRQYHGALPGDTNDAARAHVERTLRSAPITQRLKRAAATLAATR